MPVKWTKPKTTGAKPKKPVNENPSKDGKSKGKGKGKKEAK